MQVHDVTRLDEIAECSSIPRIRERVWKSEASLGDIPGGNRRILGIAAMRVVARFGRHPLHSVTLGAKGADKVARDPFDPADVLWKIVARREDSHQREAWLRTACCSATTAAPSAPLIRAGSARFLHDVTKRRITS